MNKVYVRWDPLHERVICVHTNEDDSCPKCEEAIEKLKDTSYFLKGDWHEVYDGRRRSSKELLKHEDLHFLFVEEELPEEDFKFVGIDGNVYIFDYEEFEHQLREYRREDIVDTITINNGSIQQMIDIGIAKLKK